MARCARREAAANLIYISNFNSSFNGGASGAFFIAPGIDVEYLIKLL